MTTIIKTVPIQPDQAEKKAYENYQDIVDKISKNDPMNGSDKYMLQFNINEILPKEEHVEVIKIVLRNTNKRTFTPGKNSTFVDLNDLRPSTLWKLHYYVNFCLENIKRGKKMEELHSENEIKRQEFEQKIQEELKKKYASGEIKPNNTDAPTKNRLYTFANVPSYETLRDQAIYHAHPASGEQIKITQMKQLNKQKELADKEKKGDGGFFRAYTAKKDTNVNGSPINANTKNNITLVKIPHNVIDDTNIAEKQHEALVVVHKVKIHTSETPHSDSVDGKEQEEAEDIEIQE